MDITILYPNTCTQTLTVFVWHRSIYFIIIPVAVLNSLVSDVKKDLCVVNSVMILVVLSTHAELASATTRGRSYCETGELNIWGRQMCLCLQLWMSFSDTQIHFACRDTFAVAFKARMRTSLTPSMWGHFYKSRTEIVSSLYGVLQWYLLCL